MSSGPGERPGKRVTETMIEIRRRRPSSESETQRQYCKAALSVVVTQGPFIEMAVESFPSLSFSVSLSLVRQTPGGGIMEPV